jgi:uncharacterized protein
MVDSLCETCAYRREVVSGTGSRFLLCQLSQRDHRFAKYPVQPVVACDGYARATARKPINLRAIVHAILEDYSLPRDGLHGVAHWARVLENGMRLAAATGANIEVVQLFALFHDSCRINEGWDEGHGQRGADLAAAFRGQHFQLDNRNFELLYTACAYHTDGTTDGDVTVQTCWDSDRLDLGRVGVLPEPSRLCTAAAKSREMILWADGRASFRVVPEFVKADWGLELE